MDNQWNRLVIAIGTVLTAATLTTTAVAAQGLDELAGGSEEPVATSTGVEIPTRLSNEPREDEPDGTCSACAVDDLGLDYDESGSPIATLDFYFEDNGEDEISDIVVRVLLTNGEYRFSTVCDTELLDGEFYTFTLPSGADWDWDEARYAWVEVQ